MVRTTIRKVCFLSVLLFGCVSRMLLREATTSDGGVLSQSLRRGVNVNHEPSPVDSWTQTTTDSSISGHTSCEQVVSFNNSSQEVKPFWVPSYPGSGSELFRDLVQTTTGRPAVDITKDGYDACVGTLLNNIRPATCKSHWPLFPQKAPRLTVNDFSPHAILLLRNPARAIPSWFNYRHEHHVHAQHHTLQAPKQEWKVWRDANFSQQLGEWKRLLRKWMLHNKKKGVMPFEVAVIVPYEQLVDPSTGPALLNTVLREFQNAGMTTADSANAACLWNKVVQQRPRKKRAEHHYLPSFTVEQQSEMISVLDKLQRQLSSNKALVEILAGYRQQIQNELPLDAL